MPTASKGDEGQVSQLAFSDLERLRLFSRENLRNQLASLRYFAHSYGFKHQEESKHVSVASSATCVLSLVATDTWRKHSTPAKSKALLKFLVSQNESADLAPNNPFTLAWILDAVAGLEPDCDPLDPATLRAIKKKKKILQDTLRNANGGVKIDPYPPSAYLTQLVVRVLSPLTGKLKKTVTDWAWGELARQLAIIQSQSKTADALAVAYLLMLVARVTPTTKISPEQSSIQRTALKTFFDCQGKDGTWPLSRPLFHYPKVGSAYCYEYEMLTQLLQEEELHVLLLEHLGNLRAAAEAAPNTVYHFFHTLDRLLAKAIRKELFKYLEAPLPITSARGTKKSEFAPTILDSTVKTMDRGKARQRSLKGFLWDKFVKPLWDESEATAKGRKFANQTPRSAIFFGPPGTSKTDLCRKIADFLGWPLLQIDPSHLLRSGMDAIQAEANSIFRMLEQAEGVLVLFDEFDELVLERGSPKAEAFSRFLTTAMLPKLASIHKGGTIAFVIATNNIDDFDIAIRRQGRFDHLVQVMPPTYEAKMTKKDWGVSKIDIGQTLRRLKVNLSTDIKQRIGDLTYGECDDFATHLTGETSREAAISTLEDHWGRCTLNTGVPGEKVPKTWRQRCAEEAVHTH